MEAKLATEIGVPYPARQWHELGLAYLNVYIVAYLLKARTVEPEKQPLLANGSEIKFDSRQRLGKHVPAATDTHATIEVLLETVFSTRSMQRGYKEDTAESVLYGRLWREDLRAEAEEFPLLETVIRERLLTTAGWRRLCECCGDLWIVEVSGGAVIKCNYELCV
jgi:ParB-like chromosome segregation protein Spo0J